MRRGARRRQLTTTKTYRAERSRRCMEYLRRAGSLPAARALARRDHFGAATSAWVTALGRLLSDGRSR